MAVERERLAHALERRVGPLEPAADVEKDGRKLVKKIFMRKAES